MTRWIQPTEALAEQLDMAPIPLPVSDSTADTLEGGQVDLVALAIDLHSHITGADTADPTVPALRRCAAALALAAANAASEDEQHTRASELLRIAVTHAPDDTGIRASYGSALWMSGRRFDGLAQLTRAVVLNSEQGRIVPMLWILTSRALADAGRHGDALLLLEELAIDGPSQFSFWELMDSIDDRGAAIEGGYRPELAERFVERLATATSAPASGADTFAFAAIAALGFADAEPVPAPAMSLEISASPLPRAEGVSRPGTLGVLGADIAVVRSDARPAPTAGRSTLHIELTTGNTSTEGRVAIDPGRPDQSDPVEAALAATAECLTAFPPERMVESAPFQHDLDAGASLALAALLDVIHTAANLEVPTTALPLEAVIHHACSSGARSLRDRVRELVDVDPSPDMMRTGLATLADRGFVRLDSTTVHPEPYLEFLTSGFGVAMRWWRFTHHHTHARSLSRRHFLSAGPGVLRLGPTGAGGVSWSLAGHSEFQRELGVELAIVS